MRICLGLPLLAAACSSAPPPGNSSSATASAQAAAVSTPATSPGAPTGSVTPSPSAPFATMPLGPSPAPAPSLTRAQAQARCTATVMAGLSGPERAGQVLMVGVPAVAPASAIGVVRGYQVGGVFLRGRSAISVGALRRQVDQVQAAARSGVGIPLHIAADQEGGQVQTLSGSGFPRLPSARTQGQWNSATLAARTAASATALRQAGITLNLAPVADTVAPADRSRNLPIGRVAREYGHTPSAVSADVTVVVRATQAAGVGTAVKHFPGLGRVRVNTDVSAAAVDGVTTARDANLAPFRAAVAAGTQAVMISSARYPRLDARRIAAFSPRVVTDLLRTDLRFTGIAVSDDLGAAKAVAAVPVGARAVRFVGSGGDLVLTVRAWQVETMRKALVAEAARSPMFARRLDQAATRVVTGKVAAGLIPCSPAGVPGKA
jgi:beta-N-acetylhexosaminidase